MKRLSAYVVALILGISLIYAPSYSIAQVAQVTAKPRDIDGRPKDPIFTISVNPDGTQATGGGGGGGGDASAANQSTQITAANLTNTNLGALGSTACATDNGSCSLNALIQRNNQRATSMITALGTPFQAGGSIGNTVFGATQSGTWNVGLSAGANAIGSISNTSFAATQATAASLNATVVGTGTFAVQCTSGCAGGGGGSTIEKVIVSETFTRPADTTSYVAGDRVCNSTSACTIGTLTGALAANGGVLDLTQVKLTVSGTQATLNFRIHFFGTAPTYTVNDNGVFNASGVLAANVRAANYSCFVDVGMMFVGTDGAWGRGVPGGGSCKITNPSGTSIYYAIETLSSVTGVNGETIIVEAAGDRVS